MIMVDTPIVLPFIIGRGVAAAGADLPVDADCARPAQPGRRNNRRAGIGYFLVRRPPQLASLNGPLFGSKRDLKIAASSGSAKQ